LSNSCIVFEGYAQPEGNTALLARIENVKGEQVLDYAVQQ